MVQLEICDTWKLLRVNTQKIFIEHLLCTPMRWLFWQMIVPLTINFSVYYSLFKIKCLLYHHGTSLLSDWLPWPLSWRFPYKEFLTHSLTDLRVRSKSFPGFRPSICSHSSPCPLLIFHLLVKCLLFQHWLGSFEWRIMVKRIVMHRLVLLLLHSQTYVPISTTIVFHYASHSPKPVSSSPFLILFLLLRRLILLIIQFLILSF